MSKKQILSILVVSTVFLQVYSVVLGWGALGGWSYGRREFSHPAGLVSMTNAPSDKTKSTVLWPHVMKRKNQQQKPDIVNETKPSRKLKRAAESWKRWALKAVRNETISQTSKLDKEVVPLPKVKSQKLPTSPFSSMDPSGPASRLIPSQLWYHLPPSLTPLLVLASIPRQVLRQEISGVGQALSRHIVVPLFSNPFARTVVLSGVGIAMVSWVHQEMQRKLLTPLLSVDTGPSLYRSLPPFLPELEPTSEFNSGSSTMTSEGSLGPGTNGNPQPSHQMGDVSGSAKTTLGWLTSPESRRNRREARRREAANTRRQAIMDELIARNTAQNIRHPNQANSTAELGYALVTGASQGIGRALAVELARWNIPLVLVARNADRLTSLAYELQACYGINCCVLPADLSHVDAAERIYNATTNAGLSVDILVNNAGMFHRGSAVDMPTEQVEHMVMVNSMTSAKLSQLYGQDMRKRRRGRILMVSSMAGLTAASPSAALYGATKAFTKSLTLSMAKELELDGIGVTCLVPGPVQNTRLPPSSGVGSPFAWNIPFYRKTAETVAHRGVLGLLKGANEVLPSWQDRLFDKVVRPVLPQRMEAMVVQAAWEPSPLRWSRQEASSDNTVWKPSPVTESHPPPAEVQALLLSMYKMDQPPRLLELQEPIVSENKSIEPVLEIPSENMAECNEVYPVDQSSAVDVAQDVIAIPEDEPVDLTTNVTSDATVEAVPPLPKPSEFDEDDDSLQPCLGPMDLLERESITAQDWWSDGVKSTSFDSTTSSLDLSRVDLSKDQPRRQSPVWTMFLC